MISNYSESNLKTILAFLRGKGLNEYAVFGLIGNLYSESRLRADNLQNSYESKLGMSDSQYVANVDSGKYTGFCTDRAGFGLCQWTSSGRKTGLYNYIKQCGKSISDLEAQLAYLWVELSSAYKKSVLNVLLDCQSVDEAARVVMLKFERPANQSEANQLVRVGYAQEFYDKYHTEEREQTMSKLKVAIDAGHGINTSGKRVVLAGYPDTREWLLNDRIADKLERLLKAYNCEVLRVDDSEGGRDVALADRVKEANNWGADVYISIHHNAGVNGGSGGGTVVFYYSSKTERKAQAQALYDNVVALTGLRGNRSEKVKKYAFYVIKNTKMPAFLLEDGFMDSSTDVPVILSEPHADKTAQGLLNFLIKEFKLSKAEEQATPEAGTVYRVQCGAFSSKANAEALRDKLKAEGYEAVVVSGSKL